MQHLLIIRHGESEWNLEKRWQGWLDAPLTDRGLQQARDRADALLAAGFSPEVVVSSDLGRAQATAEIIAGVLGVPSRAHPGLRERGGGEWEGSTAEEIDERWPGMREAWRRGELAGPPGGESDDHVFTRFDEALAEIPERPALVITHGGALRLIAVRAGASIDAPIANLGGYWFELDGGELKRPQPLDIRAQTEAPAVE